MKLFDLSLRLNGLPIAKAEQFFSGIIARKGKELHEWQSSTANALLNFHYQENPFYRNFLDSKGIHPQKLSSWEDIPVITKADMQTGITERLSKPFKNKKVFINNTSGSSGVPFFFAKDHWCHALTWASYKYRFGHHGIDFNRSLQARFYGIPLKGTKYYREKLKDFMASRVRFPIFNLDDETCNRFLQVFRKRPFFYLNGYTSSLVLFARFCIQSGIVLKDICPSLEVCFTTSEMCSTSDRATMELGFGVKVVNEYGAAELDLIAVEDKAGNWILNEETLFLEVVDDQGKCVSAGQPGKILVTALFNRAMPFIRYELGDIGTISPVPNADGRRILLKLEGRTNDVAILPSGRKVPGLTFYYVTKSLLEKGGTLKEFIIRQDHPSGFRLEYVAGSEMDESDKQKIRELMDTYLEPGLSIAFFRVEKVDRTKMGKLRQFQSLVTSV